MSYRSFLVVLALGATAWLAGPPSAHAQYIGRDGELVFPDNPREYRGGPPPGRYGRGWDDDDDWGDRRGYGRRGGRPRICVTSRGTCPAFAPPGVRCRCEIPGFGRKRGIVR
jgi:hypothetical protein